MTCQSISAPRWACSVWNDFRNREDVRQLGVHFGCGGLRVTTNSQTITEALIARGRKEPFEESLKKGIELEAAQKNQKEVLFNIQKSDDLHTDEF